MAFFLNGGFVGVTTLSSVAIPSSHLNIQLNGECKYGLVHISNIEKTTIELDATDLEVPPEWAGTTILMATFDDDNTGAGNVTGVTNVDSWNIFRRSSEEGSFTKLVTLDGGETNYIDYTASSEKSYKYQVYPVSNTTVANALETQFVEADFYGWYLIGEDDDVVYKFELEVSTGAITTKTDSSFIETQSKYPTQIINGNQEYESGTIQAIYGNVSNVSTLEQTVSTLETLEAFINNGKEKILKSRKGHVWRVRTDNFAISNFASEGIRQQPYLMSFSWTEVSDV